MLFFFALTGTLMFSKEKQIVLDINELVYWAHHVTLATQVHGNDTTLNNVVEVAALKLLNE